MEVRPVYVAADASKDKVAYVMIPTHCPGEEEMEQFLKTFAKGTNFDFSATEGTSTEAPSLQNEGIHLPPNLSVRSRIAAIRLYPCSG